MPVLRRIRERLRHHIVRGDLDSLGQAAIRPHVQIDRHSRVAGQHPQRGLESALGQHRGVNTLREVAKRVDRTVQLGRSLIEFGGELGEIGRHRFLGHAHPQRGCDEPLLGAVVEIALETASGLVSGNDDARARCGQRRLRLGVRDGGRDELGKAGEPGLGVVRHRFLASGRGNHDPP
jgi:hypothetical protein